MKCLISKYRPEFNSKNSFFEAGIMASAHNPSTGEAEKGDILGFLARQPRLPGVGQCRSAKGIWKGAENELSSDSLTQSYS